MVGCAGLSGRLSSTTAPSRDRDHPVGMLCDTCVVGDDHDGHPARSEATEQPEEVLGRGRVETAGRLVGEQDLRLVGQRTGDRHSLTFAAGEFGREALAAVR